MELVIVTKIFVFLNMFSCVYHVHAKFYATATLNFCVFLMLLFKLGPG